MPDYPEPIDHRYSVLLPCTPETFADFVSGLLGAPQTIERHIFHPFELRLRDIENTFHLVDQRVRQQNEASLLQFAAKIYYDDNSSVLVASLSDLLHYNEVRPIVSKGVHLTWVYLVRFPDKSVPEKQQIDLTFRAWIVEVAAEDLVFMRHRAPAHRGSITLRIAHTARSWGVDLESLITNHLHSLFVEENLVKRFAHRHSGKIGFLAFALVFFTLIIGSYATTQHFNATLVSQAEAQFAKPVSAKLDYLIRQLASGSSSTADSWFAIMLIVSVIVAGAVTIWIITLADSQRPSFVLLSRQAELSRAKALKKLERKWLMFLLSTLVAILAGVTGNWIFAIIFRHFH